MNILRTDSDHPDFRALVALLDQDLAQRDGEEHTFYAQFNKVDTIVCMEKNHPDSRPSPAE